MKTQHHQPQRGCTKTINMKTFKKLFSTSLILILFLSISCTNESDKNKSVEKFDLTNATILISPDIDNDFRKTLFQVLDEEVTSRSSIKWENKDEWTHNQPVVGLAISGEHSLKGIDVPFRIGQDFPENKTEGYRILIDKEEENTLWIIGADKRGLLYGIGKFLQIINISDTIISIAEKTDISSSPAYPIRGHQLGYRDAANSWDSWTVRQYEQYIRELVLFGSNSIEDIPFSPQSVHMKMPYKEMHIKISELCEKYDADYWVWTPATGDLKDKSIRDTELKLHEEFYKSIPRLDAIFFPGGDPGHNHPEDVMPHLKEMSKLLKKYHPEAEVWISLQGFNLEKINYFLDYLKENNPDWLRVVVNGPGSPPVQIERDSLPDKYLHRLYGDITHTIRCQYPVEDWDQAFALTLGREATNPLPLYYARILRKEIPYSNGFLSYSDGVHDDVNKIIWNQIAWNPDKNVREILVEYCRFFFGKESSQQAADGILSLEQNWVGSVILNENIEKTLSLWQNLESSHPELADNWRWQQLIMRAYYDTYVKTSLIYEQGLETEVNSALSHAEELGADIAIANALTILKKADSEPIEIELKNKVEVYCDALFNSIGLQTSVPKYQASGYERGCVLDFIDYPLNNRWWLEDEFKKIQNMDNEEEKIDRIETIRTWSNPGKDNFYDNISSVAEGLHVTSRTDDGIDYAWWDNGFSRKRLSTQLFQFSPVLEYTDLDSDADYLIRVAGYGEALLRANDIRLEPILYNKDLETFKEFILPKGSIKDGRLIITFDKPDEEHLNWRKYSKITDVWLIKQ